MRKLKSWINPKVVVKNPSIAGYGLFAKTKIKKGEKVGVFAGHQLDRNFVDYVYRNLGDYPIQIEEELWLGPKSKKEIDGVWFINHSCDPNLGFINSQTLVAIKDVKSGQELTYDYAMCTSDGYYLICKCGSVNCRQVITGDDWKLPNLQEKYAGYFTPYITKKFPFTFPLTPHKFLSKIRLVK